MADEHLQHLMKLIKEKQVYTSYALLQKIPADTSIPGKQRLIDELKAALTKGKAMHAILQNSRNNGDYPAALKQGLKLQQLVPDYPNLKHDIIAIETALKSLEATLAKAKIAASHGRKKEVIDLLQTVRQIDVHHKEIALIEKTAQRRALGKSTKSIIASILIIVIPSLLFGFEKIMIWQAQDKLDIAKNLITANKFQQANTAIRNMHNSLRYVYLFNRIKKDELKTRAASLQTSLSFVQGMRGRVIHDGEFISEDKKNIITTLEKLIFTAATLTEQHEWQEALKTYNEALAFIELHEAQIGSEDPVLRKKIAELESKQQEETRQLATTECLALIYLGDAALRQQNWHEAREKYSEAFEYANRLKVNATCVNEQTTSQYNTAVLTIFREKGDDLRSQNRPAEAVESYRQALDHATANGMSAATIVDIQTRMDGLKEQVFMTRVRLLIREGDALIKQGDFKSGLSKYNFGLTMLESSTEPIRGKAELSAILTQKINHSERTAFITAHTAGLAAFAQASLLNYFGLSPQTRLDKPVITFIEKQDNLFTYRIETNDVRDKIRYELLYQFDDDTGKWTLIENKP